MILEACVGNVKDAKSAESKGAHQIELCDRLDLDGTSPSMKCIHEVVASLSIPVKVIINPYPFRYHYTRSEIKEIIKYIKQLNAFPLAGIVFGPIDSKGMPELNVLNTISNYTDLPITYHKAIDASPDLLAATKMLIDQGIVSSILSSGGERTASEGITMLRNMNEVIKTEESSIYIIGAGKITHQNLVEIDNELDLSHYHGKLIVGDL